MGRRMQVEKPELLVAHRFAEVFPMFTPDELRQMAEDIRRNGQKESIKLHEGKVLDGRNRLKACLLGKVVPLFEEYDGRDPLGDVISWNLKRRHLNESSRAMAAASLAAMSETAKADEPKLTMEVAAKLMNVGVSTVKAAKEVLAKGDDSMIQAVNTGTVRLGAAQQVVRSETKAAQKKLVHSGAKAVVARAADLRKSANEFKEEVTDAHGESPFSPAAASAEKLPTRIARIADMVSRLTGELSTLLHQPEGERLVQYVAELKLGWIDHSGVSTDTNADGKKVKHTAKFIALTPLRRLLIASAKDKRYGKKTLDKLVNDDQSNVLDGDTVPADEPEELVIPETL